MKFFLAFRRGFDAKDQVHLDIRRFHLSKSVCRSSISFEVSVQYYLVKAFGVSVNVRTSASVKRERGSIPVPPPAKVLNCYLCTSGQLGFGYPALFLANSFHSASQSILSSIFVSC